MLESNELLAFIILYSNREFPPKHVQFVFCVKQWALKLTIYAYDLGLKETEWYCIYDT